MPTYIAKHHIVAGKGKNYFAGDELELTLQQAEALKDAVIIKKVLKAKAKAKKDS